jgi:hypothetical protein
MASMIFCCFGIFRGIASVTGRSLFAHVLVVRHPPKLTDPVVPLLVPRAGPLIAATLYHPPSDPSADHSKWGRYGFTGVVIFCGAMALLSSVGAAGLGVAKRFKKD